MQHVHTEFRMFASGFKRMPTIPLTSLHVTTVSLPTMHSEIINQRASNTVTQPARDL